MNWLDKAIAWVAPRLALKRVVAREQIAQLAIYAAADKGRRNQDWRGNSGSADLAIIPDSRTINARARQMVRDSWIAASAIKAACRNIVADGITPVPNAHSDEGDKYAAVNEHLSHLFHEWADDAKCCDVEQRQTFWQKQDLLVSERFTVGEAFLVWSYREPTKPGDPVGLRFQSFEPEQLDLTKQWYASNEVRGGIELDEQGAPVAYHFWTRNPADYLFRRQMHSVRIPAERVLHYFKQERVLQTRGVSPLTSVMQAMRDFDRYQNAQLWSAIMEACVGAAITKNVPTGAGFSLGLPPAAGDTGTTASGMRKLDFTPGMTFELGPGEDVKFLTPQRPGGSYEPFTAVTLRGIGAGIGMSYGLLARHFDANYSAARQDMLEDNKQWKPEQALLISSVIDPIYRLFVRFAIMEGRLDDVEGFDLGQFLADQKSFTEAQFIEPATPWIDPEKEMNAAEKALANQLTTREQIITEMGGRWAHVWSQKSLESQKAKELGLELPEDKAAEFKRDMFAKVASNPATSPMLANAVDIAAELEEIGIATRPGFVQADVPIPDPNASNPAPAALVATNPTIGPVPGKPTPPPGYKLAVLPSVNCGTCSQLDRNAGGLFCRKFSTNVKEDHVCDAWSATAIDADTNTNRGRTLPPYPAPGQPPIDEAFQNPGRASTNANEQTT